MILSKYIESIKELLIPKIVIYETNLYTQKIKFKLK